jgi:hypothetical protein
MLQISPVFAQTVAAMGFQISVMLWFAQRALLAAFL